LREEIGPGREEANGRRLKRHAPRAGAWIAVPAQPRPADTWFFCETPRDTKPYQPECCKNPSTKESAESAKEALWRHLEEAKYPLARTPLVSTLGQTWDCRIYVKKTPLTMPPGRPLRGSAMQTDGQMLSVFHEQQREIALPTRFYPRSWKLLVKIITRVSLIFLPEPRDASSTKVRDAS